jgi:hypothetical protein
MLSKTSFSAALGGFLFLFPCSFALAVECAGPGWVRVSPDCPVPNDLGVGDTIEVTVGSAVFSRGKIVALARCNGEVRYLTSANQSGCGWRKTITAYRRTASTSETAIEVLKTE